MANCDRFIAGNETYNSVVTVCLGDVTEPPEGNVLNIPYSVTLQPRDGGGFYAVVKIEITLDGETIYTAEHNPGFRTVERTVKAKDVPDGDHKVCLNVTNKSNIRL